METLRAAVADFKPAHVIVYDSQITVILMGELVLTAAKMAAAGKAADEIIQTLDALRATMVSISSSTTCRTWSAAAV